MNYRKESGSREIQALSPGLLTLIVKIGLKHFSFFPMPCASILIHFKCFQCESKGSVEIYSKIYSRPCIQERHYGAARKRC